MLGKILKFSAILCIVTATAVQSKIFERCELARLLKKANVSLEDIPRWLCIANNVGLDTSVIGDTDGIGAYGIFQIAEKYFCSTSTKGKICGMQCSQLIDRNLDDDIACAMTIFKRHQLLFGDGWSAWSSIGCDSVQSDVDECNLKERIDMQSFNNYQKAPDDDLPLIDYKFPKDEVETSTANRKLKSSTSDSISKTSQIPPKIQVVFDIDVNGIVHVSAKDKATGEDQQIIIHSSVSGERVNHQVHNVGDIAKLENKSPLSHDEFGKLYENIDKIRELLDNKDTIDRLQNRKDAVTLQPFSTISYKKVASEREGSQYKRPIWN